MWEQQWKSLALDHRAVCCDLRGFGASPLPPGPFVHADDVAGLLDSLGIERASLIGSSLGGLVALELAVSRSERVEKLVLLCSALQGLPTTDDVERFTDEEDALLESGNIDAATDLNVQTWLGPDASRETRALVYTMQHRAFEMQLAEPEAEPLHPSELDIAGIDKPALVVSGGRDLLYFRAVARHLAQTMRHAEHVELPWAAHLPSLERPDEVTPLLLDFLRDEEASSG